MLFNNIAYVDEHLNLVEEGYVLIEGDRIKYAGKERPKNYKGKIIGGKGKLLIPAFYNGHGHSPMSLMRGYGENMSLQNWLEKRIFPFEAHLTGKAVYWGTLLSMAESIKTGIVSTSDMYYFTENMVRAVVDSGSKANISRALVNFSNEKFDSMASVKEMRAAVENFHGIENGRILIDASIHGEYTSDEDTVRNLAEYAREKKLITHIHLSETLKENEECKSRRGVSPTKYFLECGCFDGPALAAHCVWIDEEDLDILAEKKVTVITNPASNMKLASGIAPIREILKKNINLGLGTDSVASNNSLNFFEEMKLMALGAKIKTMDPTVVSPEDAFKAATTGVAKGQGRLDCGAIVEGNKADLVLLKSNSPNLVPIHNVINNIVYSGSNGDVEMTMADGKILYNKGEFLTMDIEKVIYETSKITKEILAKL